MYPRRIAAVCLLALTGCASLPDPDDCRAYGVETRPEHQPPFTRCDVVEEIALGKEQVFERCGTWGCGVHGAFDVDGKRYCRLFWYEKDWWVLYHERCHIKHGPRHVQPLTLGEIWDGLF